MNLIKDNDDIKRILFDFYGIESQEIRRTEEGLQNENYIIEASDGKKFVLKKRIKQIYDLKAPVDRERNIAEIVYQISKKLPFIIAPRVNTKGNWITRNEDGIFLLYKFCNGIHEEYETPAIVGQVGEAISKFHNESKEYTDNCIIKEDRSFDTHIEMLKNNKAFYEKYLKSFIEEFEEMNQDNGNTTTIIHADLTPYNVIFLARKLKGIIDFDNIRVSSREEEVIRFLTSISNRPELIAEFIRRYQRVSSDPLNLTESNIRYFVYKDLIEEIGIWYEKIATKSFTKDRSFYIENLANTIKRMNRVNRSIEKLATVVNQISIVEEERE